MPFPRLPHLTLLLAWTTALPAPAQAAAPELAVRHVLRAGDTGARPLTLGIREGRIVSAAPSASSTDDAKAGFDAAGLYALPGLIDMHVHVWGEAELKAYLAHGVTTVRNLSGMPFHLTMQRRIEAGDLEGPRLFTSGPILNSPGPNAQINHQMVDTAEAARTAVRDQHAAGYRRIKTYSNLKRAPYEAARDEAKRLGMTITGHTPEGERLPGIPQDKPFRIAFSEILDDGFETIEHVESVAWHGLSGRIDGKGAAALVQRIAAAKVPVTTTLVAQRNLVRVSATHGAYAERQGTQWLNPVEQATEAENFAAWAARDPGPEMARARFYETLTKRLAEAGVPLVAGSDAGIFTNLPGDALLDELELLVRAGLTPAQAIAAATSAAAKALGEEGRIGCLDTGCAADLVLYPCDPTKDVACLRKPVAVVRAGRLYDAAALARLREEAAQHDSEATVANLVEGMAAQGTPIDPAALGL